MPGIAGIISKVPADSCRTSLMGMLDSLVHEDFYSSCVHSDSSLGVYVGAVTHTEGMGCARVTTNESESVVLVTHGECFMDPEVGIELRRRGHTLQGPTAAWLVHLYEDEGAKAF